MYEKMIWQGFRIENSTSHQVCYGIIKWLNLDTDGTGETALLPELVPEVLYIRLEVGASKGGKGSKYNKKLFRIVFMTN